MTLKFAVCAAVLLLLLLAAAPSETSPSRLCCTRYQETQVPAKVLKSFRIQDDLGHCNIKAVVFTTKKNKDFCANPDDEWVQKAMEVIAGKH